METAKNRLVKKTNEFGNWEVYTSENGRSWHQVLCDLEKNCDILVSAYQSIGFKDSTKTIVVVRK